jgi:RNA polymerase sigma-70 factor (ECF subfamily)
MTPEPADPNAAAEDTDAARLRAGDPRAFDRLYAELAPRVLGYLLRLTGGRDRAAAEDLVQETFLAAYAGRAGYAARSRPLAWLLGIARRRWRDGRRTPRREADDLAAHAETLSAPGADPAEGVSRAAELERAMELLDPAHREALELVVVQELTYKEAAAVLGTPVGTVKWRVHRATRALRNLLTEEVDANEEESRERSERRSGSAAPAPDARADRAACGG